MKCVWESHLFIAQVSLVKGDAGQLVALADVKHRHRVSPLHQLLRQVSAQETRAPDDGTPFVTLCDKRRQKKRETLQLTYRVINKPSDRVKSQLTTVDDVLTHRSNARGHDERNRHQVGGSRQLGVTRTGSQENIYILTSASDNSLYVSEHTSLVTCSTRVQIQVAL